MVHRERYAQPGFTFMELVVAVLILGILSAIGVPMYMNWRARAAENATKTNLRLIKSQIDLYKVDVGKLPSRLQELVEPPKGELAKKWKGPYFETKIPFDGWGNEFYYKVTPGAKHPFELYSYGPNGPEGAPEERISVWEL